MVQTKFKSAYVLSAIIAMLMIVQSLGGLFIDGLYQDNTFVKSAWHGNDLVTLVLAAPLLIGALIFSARGSLQAQLLWLGIHPSNHHECPGRFVHLSFGRRVVCWVKCWYLRTGRADSAMNLSQYGQLDLLRVLAGEYAI